jgi:hypothetical protein
VRPAAIRLRLRIAALAAAAAGILTACATTAQQRIANEPPTAVENLEYYPFQVKGYQNSYPHRRILVLMPVDARDFKDAAGQNHDPEGNDPAVGVELGPSGEVVQRIYSSPFTPILQQAIVRSAQEAGMDARPSNESLESALKNINEDYILASRVTGCWVNKHSAADTASGPSGPAWFTTADMALAVTIYKPPFNVAFWQGTSAATYNDPPADNGTGMGDDVPIYDQPGQVLSVALTRAVAGVFKRDELHSLVLEDKVSAR